MLSDGKIEDLFDTCHTYSSPSATGANNSV